LVADYGGCIGGGKGVDGIVERVGGIAGAAASAMTVQDAQQTLRFS
jgi:hypothetical protein